MATDTEERIDRARKALDHLREKGVNVIDGVLEAFSIAGLGARPTEVLNLWRAARTDSDGDDWTVRRRIEGAILARAGLFARKGRIQALEPAGRLLHAFVRSEHEGFCHAEYLEIVRDFLGQLPDPPQHTYAQYYLGDDWHEEEERWDEDYVTSWIESLQARGVIPAYDLTRCDLAIHHGKDPVEGRGALVAALRIHSGDGDGGWRPFRPVPEEALDSYRILCECGKHIRIKEDFAGKRGKCPKCKKKFACLNMGKLPTSLDHLILFHHDSRETAKSSLESLLELAMKGAPGPACVARFSHGQTFRRMAAKRQSEPKVFESWWERLPLKVRQDSSDPDRTALIVRESDREAWLQRAGSKKREICPGGRQSETTFADWREYGFDTVYPMVDYALLALGEEAAGLMTAEERAFFRLPEGIFHGFPKGKAGDARRFFEVAREVAAKHCKRTIYVALLEGLEQDVVSLAGREGSLSAFQTAFARQSPRILRSGGTRESDVRPEWSVTNISSLPSLQADERFYEDVKNGMLAGEYRLLDRYSAR